MILCDTGPLVAAFNEADSEHARCVSFLAANWSRLVIPSLAVTEICHLLGDPARRGRPALAASRWSNGLHGCGRHPDSCLSWPGLGRLPGSLWSGGAPATTAVRPCRTTMKPSSASTGKRMLKRLTCRPKARRTLALTVLALRGKHPV